MDRRRPLGLLPSYVDRAPKSSRTRRVLEDARKGEPAFARAYARMARSLVSADLAERIAGVLRAKAKPSTVASAVPAFDPRDPGAHEVWSRFARGLAGAYVAAVERAGARASEALPLRSRFVFRVEKAERQSLVVPPNPHSIRWIREHGAELIVGISNEQRRAIAARVERGYAKGERPEDMAASIRRNIGLTERQAEAVDRRRESVLEDTGSERQANAAADRYADEQLDLRASTIARTENKAAQSRGQQDAWLVARDEGLLPAGAKKRWVAMPESDRLSDICRELDGQVVPLDEPFHSDVLDQDIDAPPAHPACRSTVTLVFGEE